MFGDDLAIFGVSMSVGVEVIPVVTSQKSAPTASKNKSSPLIHTERTVVQPSQLTVLSRILR